MNNPNVKHLSNYKTELPCRLDEQEVARYAQRLATIEEEMGQHNERAKSIKAELAAKEAALKSERTTVARKVRTREETRLVECRIFAHFDTNRAVTVRADTGEVLTERALTPHERQGELLPGATGKAEPVLGEPKKKLKIVDAPEEDEAEDGDEDVNPQEEEQSDGE